jgi:hypothetical protein
MNETSMSASHFRVHLKEIANIVRTGGLAATVERHGAPMFAVVSLEDLEFLRRHKYGGAQKKPGQPAETARPEPQPEPEMITLIHPDLMPIELVEEAYALSRGATEGELLEWRGKAWLSIRLRRGREPEDLAPPG